jgi:hypothetical protein
MEQWDGKFRNFQQEVKKSAGGTRNAAASGIHSAPPLRMEVSPRCGWALTGPTVQNGFFYGGAVGLVGGALGGIGIGAACVATGGELVWPAFAPHCAPSASITERR